MIDNDNVTNPPLENQPEPKPNSPEPAPAPQSRADDPIERPIELASQSQTQPQKGQSHDHNISTHSYTYTYNSIPIPIPIQTTTTAATVSTATSATTITTTATTTTTTNEPEANDNNNNNHDPIEALTNPNPKPVPSALEQLYSPYILPNDSSLPSARERLLLALEQTRLLRQSFTDQLHERYGTFLQPVPTLDQLDTLVRQIRSDPQAALRQIQTVEDQKRTEKDRFKSDEEPDPLASFGGDGLHLVLLPTGPRVDHGISAASAAAAEALFDRIRRMRDPTPRVRVEPKVSLTLSPGVETGGAGSALVSKGVGRDAREEAVARYRRVVPRGLDLPAWRRVGRLGVGRVRARRVLRSVIREILGKGEEEEHREDEDLEKRGEGGGGGISEMKFMERITLLSEEHRGRMNDNDRQGNESGDAGKSSGETTVNLDVDPLLAYSVMTAVGLIQVDGEDDADAKRIEDKDTGSSVAATLGLSELMNLGTVREFVESFANDTGGANKRKHSVDSARDMPSPKKAKIDDTMIAEVDGEVLHIRGGGGGEEEEEEGTEERDEEEERSNLSAQQTHQTHSNSLSLFQQPSMYSVGPASAMGSLSSLDSYRSAVLAHQLGIPMRMVPSYPMGAASASDFSQFYLTRHMAANADPSSLGSANMSQLANLGLFPGQVNFPLHDETFTALIRREQQNVAAAAAAHFQAVMSMAPQNPYAVYPESLPHSLPQPPTTALATAASVPAATQSLSAQASSPTLPPRNHATRPPEDDELPPQQPKRSISLGTEPQINKSPKRPKLKGKVKEKETTSPVARPASAPVPPATVKLPESAETLKIDTTTDATAIATLDPQLQIIHPQSNPDSTAIYTLTSDIQLTTPELNSAVTGIDAITDDIQFRPNEPHQDVTEIDSPTPEIPFAPREPNPNVTEIVNLTHGTHPTPPELNPDVTKVNTPTPLLHFTPPEPPEGLCTEISQLILDAKFHKAYELLKKNPHQSEDVVIEYLLALAASIPIPQTLISEVLANKLRTQPALNPLIGEGSFASTSRDIIVATISVCLWTKHEDYYKKEFFNTKNTTEKPDSNWFIGVAVEKSILALSSATLKLSCKLTDMQKGEIACIVNKSLMSRVIINTKMDASLPMMGDMLELLDTLRVDALKAKVQERVLLATLVSRCGKMSEAFSNAYVSSIIRAGEALGHEEVCEIAQDENFRASTMLPYDFFHDHSGLWEDPCRPPTGVYPDTTGTELKRRAHARAMMQKSMKKLQNNLGLKGGVSDGGPYFSDTAMRVAMPSPTSTPNPSKALIVRTNSSNLKRKGSQIYDAGVMPAIGTFGVPDSMFNPGHLVTPMHWNNDDVSNTPYGRQQMGVKPILASVDSPGKKLDKSQFALQHRSTHEIRWNVVADMFLHGGSTRNIILDLGNDSGPKTTKIIAPFVGSFDISSIKMGAKEEDDDPFSDEDDSDETVLRRHRETLDDMKQKLDAAIEDKQPQAQPRGRKK